ncbi:ABC transporter permease [Paenibacillus hemerocallicola]|uniref:ABC transporter permease n=1 Tax=Paenibacillus hemerocallicola TaxID=1172614 RepID=A0A5C4SVD1_9BACL|nr:ABC transporter permease [Paenibacillus hemerocallicola]TNJ54256.1 ABC transporter permease [Paenibacillus hemerocallicola]
MNNLIKAELFKLRKDRVFRTLLLILAASAVAFPFMFYFDNLSDGDSQTPAIEYLSEALTGNGFIIKFGVSILAGFFIANEYSTGVMKTIASSGSSRGRLFLAKLTGFSVGGMLLSLVFPVILMLTASLLSGFGQLPEEASAYYIVRVAGLTLLYAASFSAVAALFATMLTESGKSIGFSIIFFMMIDWILNVIGSYIPFFKTLYDYSIFKLLGGIGKWRLESGDMTAIWLVPLLTIALSGLLGYLVYRRKEIK